MRAISYNRELRLANEQMLMLFSNIIIDKNLYTSAEKLKGCKKRKYVVKAVFGQESKIFKQIQNPTGSELVLPLVAITREGLIARDDSRVANVNYHAVMASNAATYPQRNAQGNIDPRDHYYDAEAPQPVILKYKVTFYTRDPNEMDIFMGNVAVSFNKDVWVRSPHPKIDGLALEHQVVWDGQFSTQWDSERLKETDIDIMQCSTNFDYHTEFFGGTNMIDPADAAKGIVEKIVFDTTVPGDKSPYDEFVSGEYNNGGGFLCVPLSKSFEEIESELNEKLLEKPDGDFMSYGVYNGILNEGVLNNESSTIQIALNHGANIHKHSYWPYFYSLANNDDGVYNDVIQLLRDNGALTANMPNYLSSKEMDPYTGKSPEREIHVADIVPFSMIPDILTGQTSSTSSADLIIGDTKLEKSAIKSLKAASEEPSPTQSSTRVRKHPSSH